MARCASLLIASGLVACLGTVVSAQQGATPSDSSTNADEGDARAQYPPFLSNSYFSLNVGSISYPFSRRQLEPGYQAESVDVPHVAVRAILFGHHFGKYLSAQASYIRPVKYVVYKNVNEHRTSHFVWMHFGSLTLQSRAPVNRRLSIYGEGGLGITNRSGFEIDDAPVVKNAHFASVLLGAGLEYHASATWDLVSGITYVPPSSKDSQPRTTFVSAGFRYNMRPLPAERVEETRASAFIFPENLIQVGYATNAFGYRVNNLLSRTVPIFWGGRVEVERGIVSVQYQRNVFHTKKVFAFDLGASLSRWRSRQNREKFYTVAAYPLLRFTVLRTEPADLYVSYSVAGPSYISREVIDDRDTGRHFTFQDFMGMGVFMGRSKRINLEININHYSNGNILSENAGVKIPLAFKLGYAF